MNTPQLSKDEIIHRIENLGGIYDPVSNLSLEDQLLICETIVTSTPVNDSKTDGEQGTNESGSVNGSVNGSCKRIANTELTHSKHNAITQLNQCTYRTNPKTVSILLEDIFSEYPSKPGYWFSVAQRWPPRRIYQVINYLIKLENPGHVTVRNPAAYFTYLIRKRKPRKRNNDILQSYI